jgi:very-short-patch-repair endonuclease
MDHASEKPTWHVSTKLRVRSRSLRRSLTAAERIIWYAVRAHRLNGASFRRQTPIGPFIVDFVCHDARLIIEIDGGQHFEAQNEKRDARRDRFLASKGYRVLRFSNHDVMTNRQGAVEAIDAALAASPSQPTPASGGGGEAGASGAVDTAHAASPSPPSPTCGGGRPDSELGS